MALIECYCGGVTRDDAENYTVRVLRVSPVNHGLDEGIADASTAGERSDPHGDEFDAPI
jgi:hypothetical protein